MNDPDGNSAMNDLDVNQERRRSSVRFIDDGANDDDEQDREVSHQCCTHEGENISTRRITNALNVLDVNQDGPERPHSSVHFLDDDDNQGIEHSHQCCPCGSGFHHPQPSKWQTTCTKSLAVERPRRRKMSSMWNVDG
ncbi:unnamed protein product, partial [Meganyctiphanes norvegica]